MNTLYLVRHAKSSWSDPSLSDQQRPLNQRGLKNAPEMGRRLSARGIRPDLIISSPARRAFTTASLIAAEIGYAEDVIVSDDQLYFDGITAMLGIINHTEPRLHSLMIVGHNPDMTSLLNQLCGYQVTNMPTCAIATVEFDLPWTGVERKTGRMVDYDYPKKHHD